MARIWLYFEFCPANKLIKIQIGAKSVPVNVTPQTGNPLAHKAAHLVNWGRVSKVKV